MYGFYASGVFMGRFSVGVLLGVIPLIIAFRKEYKRLGCIIPLICGVLGLYQPVASLICAVVCLILVIVLRSQRPRDFSSWEKKPETPENKQFERPAPPPEAPENMPTWKRIQLENQENKE